MMFVYVYFNIFKRKSHTIVQYSMVVAVKMSRKMEIKYFGKISVKMWITPTSNQAKICLKPLSDNFSITS